MTVINNYIKKNNVHWYLVNKMSITKGYTPPTAAPTMHDTFLDVIGSNSATFLNKDANLLIFETIFNTLFDSSTVLKTYL